MTLTTRLIEHFTTDAERCWKRMCGAEGNSRRWWEQKYNRRMRAVHYLRSRLEV